MQYAHFTVAYWCVLVAAVLPIACAGLAKWGMFFKPRREGGYDNHHPRTWLAQQTGWRARANAAQQNSFEALPLFIAAVLVAHQLGANQAQVDIFAFIFVFVRMLYIMMYVADLPKLRTVFWVLGFLVNIAIFLIGYR